MGLIATDDIPSSWWSFITDAALNYLVDGNTYAPEVDEDKLMFGVGGNAFPPGWNLQRPLFMDKAIGMDCPMVDGVVMARLVERFIKHPDIYIAEYERYYGAGCRFGQWWCQRMPFSAISFYSRLDLVAELYAVHDWGGGARFIVGDQPCPFGFMHLPDEVETRNAILERLSVYCLPSWWEGDFGKQFYNRKMLWWWWLRRAFATGFQFQYGGFWDTFQQMLTYPMDLGLLLWIMAFMHQLMCLRTARHCFCLPTRADDAFWEK